MPSDRPLILASSSPYRRDLLSRLGVAFEVLSPDVDEQRQPDELPGALALRLAELKARTIAISRPNALVIGSDQVAHLDGEFLGKPGNAHHAEHQLGLASGKEVEFLTGLTIVDAGTGTIRRHLDHTIVVFRELAPAEIARYVALDKPFDCAGGFRSEGLGIALFEKIRTDDPTALIGLPLIATARMLREFEVSIY